MRARVGRMSEQAGQPGEQEQRVVVIGPDGQPMDVEVDTAGLKTSATVTLRDAQTFGVTDAFVAKR